MNSVSYINSWWQQQTVDSIEHKQYYITIIDITYHNDDVIHGQLIEGTTQNALKTHLKNSFNETHSHQFYNISSFQYDQLMWMTKRLVWACNLTSTS